MDTEYLLGEAANDALDEDYFQGDNNDKFTATFNSALEDAFTQEPSRPNYDQEKKSRPGKGKKSILKEAAEVVAREGQQQARQFMQVAAADMEDVFAEEQEQQASSDLVAQILGESEPELDFTPDLIDQVLEEAGGDDLVAQVLHDVGGGDDEYNDDYQDDDKADIDSINNESEDNESEDEEDEDDEEGIQSDPAIEMEMRHYCYSGNYSRLEKLIQKDVANIQATDVHGWTCLHWAVSKNQYEIADLLISNAKKPKSFINAVDNLCGWTALHVACIGGHKDCVRTLLEHHAKIKKKNLFGETAADCITISRKTPEGKAIRKLLGISVVN
eukprot:gene12356-25993_t